MLEVACWPGVRRRAPPLRGRLAHRRRAARPGQGAGRARPARARDLLARLLPEQPPPRPRRAARRQHASAEGDRRRSGARRARRSARSSAATRRRTCRTTSASSARSGRGWSRTRRASGVNVAIENCPMIFSWDEWPGGTNLASTPAVWDEMFTIVPSKRFGLNLDPSHLVWLQIDYERVVRDYASRLLHVHAKDMEIDRDGLYRHGTASQGMGWQVPAAPRARRGALGPVPLAALPGRLRRRGLRRARGPRVRADRGAREARLPHRARRAQPVSPLTTGGRAAGVGDPKSDTDAGHRRGCRPSNG